VNICVAAATEAGFVRARGPPPRAGSNQPGIGKENANALSSSSGAAGKNPPAHIHKQSAPWSPPFARKKVRF